MADDETTKVAELLQGKRTAMLLTTDETGTFVNRPMALQQVEFDGDLWFFAEGGSRKVAHIRRDPAVNVAVADASEWVSVDGRAEIVTDAAKKRDLWNPVVEAWFPDGPDDAGIVLIKVNGDSAEYWDTPGGRIASVVSFAKAKVTGEPYSGGETGRVDLG